MLTAIDAVASCRKGGVFVSPRYAFALAFAIEWTKAGTPEAARIATEQVFMDLPAVENADGTCMLAKTKDSVVLMKSNATPRDLEVAGAVENMGFSDDGQLFGVTASGQKPMLWTTNSPSKPKPVKKHH